MTRAKTIRRSPKRPLLMRTGAVVDWGGNVFVNAERAKGEDLRRTLVSLDVSGTFTEPVKGVDAFVLTVHPSDQVDTSAAEIAGVGAFISMKRELHGVVSIMANEFDFVLALAAAGKLRLVDVTFQEPRYRSALIAGVSFRTRTTDDDQAT